MSHTKKVVPCLLASLFLVLVSLPMWAATKTDDEESIRNATNVLRAMLESKDVPASVLSKADCVIVLPSVKKFAVGVGGSGGRGPMSCRSGDNFNGKWSPPAMYSIAGASAGLQIGGSSTDYVLLLMAPKAVEAIVKGKSKIGSDVTAAAGPSGASAMTGSADVLTYSRAKGLFAGVSLDGSTLDPDSDANQRLYDQPTSVHAIVRDNAVKATPAGQSLMTLLDSKLAR
ncbi:MAG: lipid-binding SYLF domain-containing protein [Candidatus Korobacteraceae bacterium]|jgi:lipid-binding SYLF domain-containing protein